MNSENLLKIRVANSAEYRFFPQFNNRNQMKDTLFESKLLSDAIFNDFILFRKL